MLQRFIFIITTLIVWHLCIFGTLAQEKKVEDMDKFPPNPLEITLPDPLLPNLPDIPRLP